MKFPFRAETGASARSFRQSAAASGVCVVCYEEDGLVPAAHDGGQKAQVLVRREFSRVAVVCRATFNSGKRSIARRSLPFYFYDDTILYRCLFVASSEKVQVCIVLTCCGDIPLETECQMTDLK